jgi:hypothetical protein
LVLLKGRRRIERQGTWSFKLGSSEAQEREKKEKGPRVVVGREEKIKNFSKLEPRSLNPRTKRR